MTTIPSQSNDRPELLKTPERDFLMSKQIQPPTESQKEELSKISKYDVTKYSEADVRAVIIDPVVKILGYEKEQDFSVNRERHLKVLDGDLYIDYELTLWKESFWVIEAKKVNRDKQKFTKAELLQALGYAAHPDINAALMVLCDGRVFEIYDRELSLTSPVERVEVAELVGNFEKLQRYLSPWQAWFFQKRRIPRLVDKVMDREMTVGRIEELRGSINDRLDLKQAIARENRRALLSEIDLDEERRKYFSSLDLPDLVEDLMFAVRSSSDVSTIVKTIVEKGGKHGFCALVRIFDERPRNMNDCFVFYSLRVLIEYESSEHKPTWLPQWLTGNAQAADLETAIKNLIKLTLDSFSADKARQIILQYSSCVRRISKILLAVLPEASSHGQFSHRQIRHFVDELSDLQLMSTPQRASLLSLDTMQHYLTSMFIRQHRDERREFNVAGALTALKDAWATEKALLQDGTDYRNSLKGRKLDDELYPTEVNWVAYDNLAHTVLCSLETSEKWMDYVKATHHSDLLRVAAMGSWKARELLGENVAVPSVSDQDYADRFFHGNIALFRSLYTGYSARPTV